MGQMWGYEMHSATIPSLRIALYARSRPTCEVQRAKDVGDLGKMPWAGLIPPQECRIVIVGPGADYWAYAFSDGAQAASAQELVREVARGEPECLSPRRVPTHIPAVCSMMQRTGGPVVTIKLPELTWQEILDAQRAGSAGPLRPSTIAALRRATNIWEQDPALEYRIVECTESEDIDLRDWCEKAADALRHSREPQDQEQAGRLAQALRFIDEGVRLR